VKTVLRQDSVLKLNITGYITYTFWYNTITDNTMFFFGQTKLSNALESVFWTTTHFTIQSYSTTH